MILLKTTVPADDLPATEQRVKRFAKRAKAKGLPVPTLVIGAAVKKVIGYVPSGMSATGETNRPVYGMATEVEIHATGELALGDWRVVSIVNRVRMPDGSSAPVRMKVDIDGPTLPDSILLLDPTACQQCGKARRRTDTFVVTNGEQWMQVGRDCVKDLTGHDPADLLAFTRWQNDLRDEDPMEGFGSSASPWYAPRHIVELAAEVATAYGYVSKAKAGATAEATANIVQAILDHDKQELADLKRSLDNTPEATLRIANLVVNTVDALDELVKKDVHSDYEWTLVGLWQAESILAKHIGFMASAVTVGYRRIEHEARQKAAVAEAAPSVHLGTVGERLRKLAATVTLIRAFDGEYGTRYLIKLRTADADLAWWTGNPGDLEVNDTVAIDGTVKRHDTDKLTGLPVTTLTRVKALAPA